MTAPHYTDELVTLHHGDCLDVLRTLPDASVDSIVTDPPYGLANTTSAQVTETITAWLAGDREYLPGGSGFMGKAWDAFVPPVAVWDEAMRVLKPGGHLLAFAGSRTFDLIALAIRLAGFDVRDSIAWLYGSGFPKSLNVAKAIATGGGRPEDIRRAAMGDEYTPSGRGRVNYDHGGASAMNGSAGDVPLTPDAERWQGWGTALKPSFEPIVVARKPLAGTVAANVLTHGTGALNIDACRVGDEVLPEQKAGKARIGTFERTDMVAAERTGRGQTNVVLDESQAAELDEQTGVLTSGKMSPVKDGAKRQGAAYGAFAARTETGTYGDSGGASRFFPTFRYEAKAPTTERPRDGETAHPAVKPLDLMRWLVRLVTPPGGTVLEPFAGSGTTAEACVIEGFRCIAIEREADYLPLITQRLMKPIALTLDLA